MKQKIVFFIETKEPLSSVQCLFLQLSCHMSKNADYSTEYINNWHLSDIEKFPYCLDIYRDINTTDFSQYEGAVFFTPINYLMHLVVRIKDLKNATICLYVYDRKAPEWLYFNLKALKAGPSEKASLDSLIYNLSSCAFLNFNCVNPPLSSISNSELIRYLPLCLDYIIEDKYEEQPQIDRNSINIGYIGNLTPASINSISNIIRNLSVQRLSIPVNIHIVGNVTSLYNFPFRKCSSEITKIIYTGPLTAEQRKQYCQKNIDICFGVGINAIEPATWGIPVVLPVVDEKPFIGNRYVFLFDVTNHIYSWDNNSLLGLDNSCYTLTQIINEVYKKKRKNQLAKLCYEYYKKNNSYDVLESTLISLIKENTLTLDSLLINPIISSRMADFSVYSETNEGGFRDFLEYEKSNLQQAKNDTITLPTPLPKITKKPSKNSISLKNSFLKVQKSFGKKND